MSLAMQNEVETKILTAAVDQLLAAGFRLTVSLERGYDLDECLIASTDQAKIIKEARAGDDCHIFIHAAQGEAVVDDQLNSIGWLYFVWANDGWDCLSDYTVNLESHLAQAHAIASHYAR